MIEVVFLAAKYAEHGLLGDAINLSGADGNTHLAVDRPLSMPN